MLTNKTNDQKNVTDEEMRALENAAKETTKYRITPIEMMVLYDKVRIPFFENKTPSLYLNFDSEFLYSW